MPDIEEDFKGIIIAILGFSALMLFLLSVYLALPLIALGGGVWLFYRWKTKSPAALEAKAREDIHKLYREAKSKAPASMSKDQFVDKVLYYIRPMRQELREAVERLARTLYDDEQFGVEVPEPPAVCHSIEGAQYRDRLSSYMAKTADAGSANTAANVIGDSVHWFLDHAPSVIGISEEHEPLFVGPIGERLDDTKEAVKDLLLPYLGEDARGLFTDLRDQLMRNIIEASGLPYNSESIYDKKWTMPGEYKGDDAPYAYLKGTPLLAILDAPIPVSFSNEARFEHTWCLAPPGTGKTQLIQYLVSRDLEEVQRDRASIVVIDSQGDLINRIRRLKLFWGGGLTDQLIVIEPSLTHPPALNIFDMGRERMHAYSPDDREKFTTIAIGQMTYVLDALMGSESGGLTPKQETLFRYIIRLLMELPDGTINRFRDLLEIKKPPELEPYQEHIRRLPPAAQDFFSDQFFDSEFSGTRRQVAWRIAKLRENTYFDRMFSHPKSKIDLFTELNSAKVILINADKERLGEDGTNVFGRFFISMLLTASQERASLPQSQRLPVYCYIDEAQDYISTDTKIATMLDQARKMRIALFLAHQRTKQIRSPNVLDALVNTAIKYASTDNPHDADLAARSMQTKSQFVANQKRGHFALSVRRDTGGAVSVRVPFGVMEKLETMTSADEAYVREMMYDRYCAPPPIPEPPPEPEQADVSRSAHDDPDNPSTDATAEV